MTKQQHVFSFQEGNAGKKAVLGGKGANLAEMTRIGLPVPPGFTISTEACRAYFAQGQRVSAELLEEIGHAMGRLEEQKGERFGDPAGPLLVSVRSGSVSSMPGMMDTILNVGLNDETVEGLARRTGDERFAFDCYRRLIQMFGEVVLGVESHHFEQLLFQLKKQEGVTSDQDISAEGWKRLIVKYKTVCQKFAGASFPQHVHDQLVMAVEAVFRSWHNPRAVAYRNAHKIPESQGTAVNVQAMVFGNRGADSGTGVVFTRNPSTGENRLFGEYMMNAQGEDVVAGVRTPNSIASLEKELPDVYTELVETAKLLEAHYKEMQDVEFTVEAGKLYLLQTRSGKRTAQAAVKLAVDFVREGIISKREALMRIEPMHLEQLLHRGLDEEEAKDIVATGLPASPGAAVGQLVFDADRAVEWSRAGKTVILARAETTPDDIHGVLSAEGILTSCGGMTSHAAVVARGMGKPCVCGCVDIEVHAEEGFMTTRGGRLIREGEWLTLDGATGRVITGQVPLREAALTDELLELLQWADEIRTLRVYANADHPRDATVARKLGAEGIGLCRTEHMFFQPARLAVMQQMILADTAEERRLALDKLLPMQQADFEGMFDEMDGMPVTIRLLDPPLHEFLPNAGDLQEQLRQLEQAPQHDGEKERLRKLLRRVQLLHEVNPMLGQRGCRLGIVFPDIYEMQIEAIFKAASRCIDRNRKVVPDIMIPLVGHVSELKVLRELVDLVAAQVLGAEKRRECTYRVGTMIEVPRAALTAAQIAAHADFFSFGTNDLTQMTYGYSRDDAEGKFLTHYIERKLLPDNPFHTLDEEGVGELIRVAAAAGRGVKRSLKLGICGEHGGNKESIVFCHRIGLDYVSCSPYRIPLARIAAAQAWIEHGEGGQELAGGLLVPALHTS